MLALPFSVVVAVHNEAENVLALAQELHDVLSGLGRFELIFVDDGSADATAERLDEASRRFPDVVAVRHAARLGQSSAQRTGIRRARYEWIVTMDGDLQNDPRDIPALFEALDRPGARAPGLVAGIRVKRRDTLSKRLASRAANAIRRALLHDDCPDTGCGLKLIRRDVYLELPFFNALHRFLPALVRMYGHEVRHVPVNHRARSWGRTKYGNLSRALLGIADLAGVLWLRARTSVPAQSAAAAKARPADAPPQSASAQRKEPTSCLPLGNGGPSSRVLN